MTRRLLLIVSASSLLTMALALATPALAAAPTSEIIVITDFQYVDEALCDFPVTFVDNGTFKLTTFYDDAGNPVKSVATNYRTRYTVSATANDKTLTTNAPAVVVESFEHATELVLGLHNAYHVPGEGVVLLDAGRILIDLQTGQALSEAGPHQLFAGNAQAFCGFFTDPLFPSAVGPSVRV
jgi:hypothetical protein